MRGLGGRRWWDRGALLASVLFSLGCERKAPSPEECLDFAMLGLPGNDRRLLAVPELKERIDEVVVRCLTTPFDKELIKCMKVRHASKSCLLEFEERERRKSGAYNRK